MSETIGVSKSSILHSFKCLNDNGFGNLSTVLLALDEICSSPNSIYLKGIILMPFIMNNSKNFDLILYEIKLLGFLIIAPAGNFNSNTCLYSPGNSKHVLTIGSIDPITKKNSSFSNSGPCVNLYANGVNLLTINNEKQLMYKSGTSMSMALVAGAIGNFYNKNDPDDSIRELKNFVSILITNSSFLLNL